MGACRINTVIYSQTRCVSQVADPEVLACLCQFSLKNLPPGSLKSLFLHTRHCWGWGSEIHQNMAFWVTSKIIKGTEKRKGYAAKAKHNNRINQIQAKKNTRQRSRNKTESRSWDLGETVLFKITILREFPGGPVVRTWRFQYWDLDSIPGLGTKVLQVAQHGQK